MQPILPLNHLQCKKCESFILLCKSCKRITMDCGLYMFVTIVRHIPHRSGLWVLVEFLCLKGHYGGEVDKGCRHMLVAKTSVWKIGRTYVVVWLRWSFWHVVFGVFVRNGFTKLSPFTNPKLSPYKWLYHSGSPYKNLHQNGSRAWVVYFFHYHLCANWHPYYLEYIFAFSLSMIQHCKIWLTNPIFLMD